MVTPISQVDPRWANVRIGNSAATLGEFGCTITSICMVIEKLRGYAANPANAARHWAFNLRGEIIWRQTQFHGIKFVDRIGGPDIIRIRQFANDPKKGAIAEVNNGAHWVYVDEAHIDGDLSIIDPIDGKYYESMPSKYRLTGAAVFEKSEIVPQWMKEAIDKAKARGLDVQDPLDQVNIVKLEGVLKDLGLINQVQGNITLGRLLVIIDRMSEAL